MTTLQSWDEYQAAVVGWVQFSTGLATGKILWAKQGTKRPKGDFIVLDSAGLEPVGMDWVDREDADPVVVGAELIHVARGTRMLTVRVTAYGGALGENGALARINKIMTSAKLPTPKAALIGAGLGLAGFSKVTSLGGQLGGGGGSVPVEIEPRAFVDVSFNVVAEARETTTYIDSFEGTHTARHPPSADLVETWTVDEPED